jgi:hypothetical protein
MKNSYEATGTVTSRAWRGLMVCVGLLAVVVTFGFYFQAPWATSLWPWPDGRMTYIFVASIAAAIALPNLWIALAGRAWAIGPGALNLAVAHLGISAFLFAAASQGNARLSLVASVFAATGVLEAVACFWSLRQPLKDARPTPRTVRASFLLFAILLLVTGFFLVMKAPHIFPWPLKPETSVLVGWIFWGAALYFGAGFVRPVWENACGQLLGFLAYDVILIGPYVAHLQKVKPEHALSLKVYIAVLAYSGLLAIYYLFIHGSTRFRINEVLDGAVGPVADPPL